MSEPAHATTTVGVQREPLDLPEGAPRTQPEPGPAAMVRTIRLSKVYGPSPDAAPAVDQLDLEIRAGEIFGLLGPNGAGKTTTIGMLSGRVVPTSGHAYVGGVDVEADPAGAKMCIGVSTQTNTLDRSLSVRDNLVFHGRYFGMSARQARVEADRLLELFRLADRASSPAMTFFGGLAQRLMIARAVMHRPAVLILDEPTAGLDPLSRIELWQLVRSLNAEGQTVLLTTHQMDEADALCDRVAIMDKGRIVALDSPAELKRVVDADTIISVRAVADPDARLGAVLAQVPGVVSVVPSSRGVQVRARARTSLLPDLLAAAEAASLAIDDVSVAEPTLETVFLHLTGRDLRA